MTDTDYATRGIRLPAPMRDHLVRLAEEAFPNEAVAMVGFERGNPRLIAPVPNHSPDPRRTFYVAPYKQWEVERAFNREGCTLGATFHSHPTGRPVPSQADLDWATEGVLMMIAGRRNTDELLGWSLRAYDGARPVSLLTTEAS